MISVGPEPEAVVPASKTPRGDLRGARRCRAIPGGVAASAQYAEPRIMRSSGGLSATCAAFGGCQTPHNCWAFICR